MAESDVVARLLEEYSSKPPKVHLDAEEQKHLAQFVLKDRTFRKLKNMVRITAWEQMIPSMNEDPANPDFAIRFAQAQAMRDGMLRAIDLLETFVEDESNE
jgi:DTW domain-containing protein YfiP